VKFWSYVITPDGIEIGEEKIEAIKEWQALQSLRNVQSILRFENFYRRFIMNFSKICQPLRASTNSKK
jgi:hypothetical protein